MPTQLPPDPVLFEQTIASRIRDILVSVSLINANCKVYARERFPDNEAEDISISTVPDPVNADIPRTSIIQIGIPTVEELEYTGDTCTQINFTYPITFDSEVKDLWDTTGASLQYTDSRSLAMAIYMLARAAFKANRDLGFNNVSHNYLQQENAGTVADEESGGRLHTADWSLVVRCTSAVV